jgi:hypothetical protein
MKGGRQVSDLTRDVVPSFAVLFLSPSLLCVSFLLHHSVRANFDNMNAISPPTLRDTSLHGTMGPFVRVPFPKDAPGLSPLPADGIRRRSLGLF